MKKLFLSLMLLLAAGSSVELSAGCSAARQFVCSTAANSCGSSWHDCYNTCCNS